MERFPAQPLGPFRIRRFGLCTSRIKAWLHHRIHCRIDALNARNMRLDHLASAKLSLGNPSGQTTGRHFDQHDENPIPIKAAWPLPSSHGILSPMRRLFPLMLSLACRDAELPMCQQDFTMDSNGDASRTVTLVDDALPGPLVLQMVIPWEEARYPHGAPGAVFVHGGWTSDIIPLGDDQAHLVGGTGAWSIYVNLPWRKRYNVQRRRKRPTRKRLQTSNWSGSSLQRRHDRRQLRVQNG